MRARILAVLVFAFILSGPASATTFPPVNSTIVTIKGDWFGHTTPAAQYRAYQNPGDTFRIICPEPCPVDPNVIAAFHSGFSQAAQRTVAFFGLDILPSLKPIDLHIANDTWCGNYSSGFTGDSGIYPSSSGLTTAYGCFWYANRPDFFEPFTADNVSQVNYHLLTVHEYTHPIFFGRHFYSYEDFAKVSSFFVSGIAGAPPITDPCADHLFDLNQGRLPWALCRLNGFSYGDLPPAMQQLDALFQSGKGTVDQGVPNTTSVIQFRKILNGVLGSDTRDAFLSTLIPPAQVEDDTTLPGSGGAAWLFGGWVSFELPPGAVAGNPSIHSAATYSLPGSAIVPNLDFNTIYVFSPPVAFSKPVTVRFKYDPSLLFYGETPAVREETLKLYRLVGNSWQLVPGSRVDTINSEVVATVSSLGTLGFFGSTSSPVGRSLYLSGIGSVQGANGSNFRTALQLHNGGTAGSSGQLIFRAPGNPADGKALPYSLVFGETQSIPDLVSSFGASGLGSLEIQPSSGQAPVVTARIFNDAGAAGTAGFSEEASKESSALSTGDSAVLLAPPDLSAQRFNIGVRALAQGVSLSATIRNAAGSVVATVNRSFPANALDQETAQQFAPGVAFSGNESVTIRISAGSAFVFGVAVDNRTNDTSFEGARNLAFAAGEGGIEYVPAVGSLPGANGANFKTAFQMHNSSPASVSGKLVYHAAAHSAAPGDPSLAYALAAGQTLSYPDLLAAFGLTGLGTLDVVPASGSPPLVLARVINDLGPGGGLGLAEEAATAAEVLKPGDHADAIIPPDLSKQRMNLGIRTFGAALLAVTLSDASGRFKGDRPLVKALPSGEFQQYSLQEFLGSGVAIPAGGSVRIEVIGGQALVYASVVDNVTNDSSYQIARRLPFF
ncbi:MAG: hypothetical protein ACRD16_14385 [Thermoanaerobaculia bacterium]